MLAMALCACTGGDASESESSRLHHGAKPLVTCAASASNTSFKGIRHTRAATAAQILIVDETGQRRVTDVDDLRQQIVPTVISRTPSKPTTRSLLATFSKTVAVSLVSGPARQLADSWDQPLSPGTYVTFTGADIVRADYRTRCGNDVARGSVRSWAIPTAGILDCRLPAPEGSTAAIVDHLCR
jgi:hypothetical protein